jgi:hypothetical protein
MRRSAILVLVLFGLSVSSVAGAQPAPATPSAADVSAARALGAEGVKLAEKGRCAEAVEKLERSEKLYHAPTTLGRLAECQIELGKIVLGTENLQRLLREPVAVNSPAAFTAARARAEKVLAHAKPRIASLQINVSAPPSTKIDLTVDGVAVSDMFIGNEWPADPGQHVVEATSPGFLKANANVALKDGETEKLSLKLEVDPSYVKPSTPEPVVAKPSDGENTPPPPPAPKSNTLAYAAFGVGAVGVVVGSVTGILFLGKNSDLSKSCPDKICSTVAGQSDLSGTKTMGNISTIGFIVGGVGVAAGAVLLLTGGAPAKASVTGKSAAKANELTVLPVVGGNYLGLSGSF